MQTEAAVSREGQLHPRIESVDIDEPRSGEILVRMVASGICHTDLRCHAGASMPIPRPIVLGHEGAGIVEQIGEDAGDLQVGDRVVLSGSSCGECACCRRNRPSYCREAMLRSFGGSRVDGSSALSQNGQRMHGHFFGQSSFARHAIAEARSAVKMPQDAPLELLGPLGCGVITGAGTVLEALRVAPGQSLVVFGSGAVGLSAIMAARLAGALSIVAVDTLAHRLELALDLGATDVVPAGEGVVDAIREILPDGADFVFNTTSTPAVFTQAVACLGMQGEMVFVAPPAGPWQPPMMGLLSGGRKLRGILGGDAAPQLFLPLLMEYWRQGRFPFDRLITQYPFERIADAWNDVKIGKAIKPVLLFDHASAPASTETTQGAEVQQ